jgi:hypothetical protein
MDGDYCVSKILYIKYLDSEYGMRDVIIELKREYFNFLESHKNIPICSDHNT